MKIGIYGGTFDPIHKGHAAIANAVKAELGLDCVQLIVAADPPHKEHETPAQVRYAMTEAASETYDGIYASDIEIKRGGVSYTVNTLEEMKKMYPTSELFFILGADMLANFEKWYMPERISTLATLVAVQRSGQEQQLQSIAQKLDEKFGARVIISSFIGPELSSTEIRRRVFEAEPIKGLVQSKVERYIYENRLYLPDDIKAITDRLELTLDRSRFVHSLLTAREAVLLASNYGLDTKKARLCALLHDCAKLRGKSLDECILKHGFVLTDEEKNNPYMIHARLGVEVAKKDFGIDDEQILCAIKNHTLGAADMSDFDKIIFLADKLEPSRDYRKIADIRKLAYENLDKAVVQVIKNNIDYNNAHSKPVHPSTYKTLAAFENRE